MLSDNPFDGDTREVVPGILILMEVLLSQDEILLMEREFVKAFLRY